MILAARTRDHPRFAIFPTQARRGLSPEARPNHRSRAQIAPTPRPNHAPTRPAAVFLVIHVLSFLVVLFAVILLIVTQWVVSDRPRMIGSSGTRLGDDCYNYDNHDHGALPWMVVIITYYWSNELWNCVRYFVVAFTTGVWYFRNESLASQSGQVSAKHYTRQPVRTDAPRGATEPNRTSPFDLLLTRWELCAPAGVHCDRPRPHKVFWLDLFRCVDHGDLRVPS